MEFGIKQSSKYSLACIALLLPLLPACGPQYKAKELTPLNHQSAQYEETKSNMSLKIRALNLKEANELFDGRGHYLFDRKNPVYPIHCSVTNESDHTITLDKKDIGLSSVNSGKAFQMMRMSAAQRNSAFAVGGLLAAAGVIALSGVILFVTSDCSCPCYLLTLIPLTGLVGALYLISLPVGGVYTTNICEVANKTLDADVIKKQVSDVITIQPGQAVSFIFFADGTKYQPQFALSVVGACEQRVTFDVYLSQSPQNDFVKA